MSAAFLQQMIGQVLLGIDVLENSMIKTELHEGSADERRNASGY